MTSGASSSGAANGEPFTLPPRSGAAEQPDMFRPRGFSPPRRLSPPLARERVAAHSRSWVHRVSALERQRYRRHHHASSPMRHPPEPSPPPAAVPASPQAVPPRRSPRPLSEIWCDLGALLHRGVRGDAVPWPARVARCSPGLPFPGSAERSTLRRSDGIGEANLACATADVSSSRRSTPKGR